MANVIIAHFVQITTFSEEERRALAATSLNEPRVDSLSGTVHRYQNFFYASGSSVAVPGESAPLYEFAPFRAEGSLASLNGENAPLRLLFPHSAFTVALVENGNGNRLSRLTMKTVWLGNAGNLSSYEDYALVAPPYQEYYIGVGATFDDTTVELRFRSSMDSVGAAFPRRTFNSANVGILPINAEISLR